MGSGQVVSTIIELAIEALREHPLLVLPTFILVLGVVGLAVLEAATITVEVATLMIRRYQNRTTEFIEALRDLRAESGSRKKPKLQPADFRGARTDVVQKDRLAQQRLFDRFGK